MNGTLTSLDVSDNLLRSIGSKAVLDSVVAHPSLTYLSIFSLVILFFFIIYFGWEGKNTLYKYFYFPDIARNQLQGDGGLALASVLRFNTTLLTVKAGENDII